MDQTILTQCKAALLIPNGSVQSTAYQVACKIDHLWRLALGIFPAHRNLSCKYVKELVTIAKRSTLDTHFIQSCFCGSCHLIFVPGFTCQVSQHKRSISSQAYKRASRIARQKHLVTSEIAPYSEMVYTCNSCGSTTSICNSTRKQEGEKKARAFAKEKEKKKRRQTSEPLNSPVKKSKKMKTDSTAAEVKEIPTSILSITPRRKKKEKAKPKGLLSSFVNNF